MFTVHLRDKEVLVGLSRSVVQTVVTVVSETLEKPSGWVTSW
jgi:hypothetical protein